MVQSVGLSSLSNSVKAMDNASLYSTDSSVSISYMAWLTSVGLVNREDIAALKSLPQGRHHDSLDSLLSLMMSATWSPCTTTLELEVDCVLLLAQWWLLWEPPPR